MSADAKIECRLPKSLPNGTRVPCFEETEPGQGRPITAVVDDRCLDRSWSGPHGPYEGGYMIPLDGEPTYDNEDPYENGPWHFIDVHINNGQVQVEEVRWVVKGIDHQSERIDHTDLDWEFGDDDGVETIRIPRDGVTIVVPLRFVPDSREVPRDSSMSASRRRPPSPAERRRNGLTV